MNAARSASAIGLAALGMTIAGCDEPAAGQSARTPSPPVAGAAAAVPATRIRLIVDGRTLPARLNDSPPAQAFARMLPLTLELEDFHATEKIAMLPRKLDRQGRAKDVVPRIGDLTYYAPWGNLAIFYKDFDYSDDLIPLGRIEGDIGSIGRPGNVQIRIEREED